MLERSRPIPPEIPGASYMRFLGAGGFADVFLYRQEAPSRDVAVKVIRAEALLEAKDRFKRETDIMALLSSHPSVVSVYDAGQTKDQRGYIVMEYCPPPHLGQLCKQEPPSLDRVLKYAIQIGSAVETIHRSGYLHRDIKPANILMTSFNRPVLTDFGIAVPIEAQVVEDDFGGASPPWAPYEQQLGDEALTPSADVYALGATVYTMITGHAPHVDQSAGASNERTDMLRRAQMGLISPITRADVPDQLRRVLRTAMAPQPADRYQTALALVRDLQKIQRDQNLTVTEADVMEQALPDTGGAGEADHTILRPVTAIDPYQGTQDALVADATRFKPRIIIPLAEVAEQTSADTMLGSPGQPLTNSGGPLVQTGGAGLLAPSGETTGSRSKTDDFRRETTASPVPAAPVQSKAEAARDTEDGTPTQDPGEAPPSRRLVLGIVAAAVLALALGGIGVWSSQRNEGGSKKVSATATPEIDVVGPGGEVAQDVGVTNLQLAVNGKQVTATWDYESAAGVTFLYSVVDPANQRQLKETKEHTATVDAIPGRTCVEVVVRAASGSSSAPTTKCQETP
ncbi:Serine/threonine-protein kinase pknK [Actinomyces bovis]|uniref:non-specific serine/threonine protein kinase n=1 Tax=Actinomyces bovis TaxID=1658 RepID=A0ABY1VLR4_9ACTO|nr:serine/threonine-protein kinase [Actinomyces bovis]SPT52955.1 Serine/threonine-protein kinase pknK [Actinomyces bovis]VEG55149.1 Serine/threonine-protein kinase pknK [Actinomyces israelii]